MKKLIFVALLSLLGMRTWAENMDSLFVRVPQSVLPLLDRNARLDMTDLYNYKMQAKATNMMDGTSLLLKKSDDYLHLRLTEVSTWTLKRLTLGADTLFCCVHTLDAGGKESRIRFYRTDWTETNVSVPQPCFDEFWHAADTLSSQRAEELRGKFFPLLIEAAWSADKPELTLSISTAPLSTTDREEAQRCLRAITYRWTGNGFEKI